MSAIQRAKRPLHYRAFDFEIRESDDAEGKYFEGYCAVHNNIDSYRTIMGAGCFERDIDHFRQNGFIGGLNHNWDEPIGKPNVKTKADKIGLYVGADVLDTQHGMDVRKLLKAGVCKKLSFGFEDLDRRYLEQREDVERYWDSVKYSPSEEDRELAKDGALLFTRLKVFECSPVMAAGNDRASITAVREDDGARTAFPSLETHSLIVRDAIAEFCVRLEQLAQVRISDGRSLSPANQATLRQIRDRADKAMAACRPMATRSDVASLRRELFDLETAVLAS